MPITPSLPGLFPEELARDERAVRALPTSITAFAGRAERGPLDEPVTVHDFAGFARTFGLGGGLPSLASAVRAFFANGGAHAVVIRIARSAAAARLEHGPLALSAASAGSWGNALRLRVRRGFGGAFHLQIRDGVTGRIETHCDVTLADSPRRVDRVVNARSQLVRWAGSAPNPRATLREHARSAAAGRTVWTDDHASTPVTPSQRGSCGAKLSAADFAGDDKAASHRGLFSLDRVDLVNLLVIPPYRDRRDVEPALWRAASSWCAARRAFLVMEPRRGVSRAKLRCALERLELASPDAAIFLPRENAGESLGGGAAAGLISRTDAQRGPWRVPVEIAAIQSRAARALSPRSPGAKLRPPRPAQRVTPVAVELGSSGAFWDDAPLVAVRRTALHLEDSLQRGLRWVKSEPNDESLWAEIRTRVGAFLHELFRLGAFAGESPRDAWFVKCDEETTSARDVERGVVNVVVGFAPFAPREFVTLRLAQSCGAAPL